MQLPGRGTAVGQWPPDVQLETLAHLMLPVTSPTRRHSPGTQALGLGLGLGLAGSGVRSATIRGVPVL